MTLKEVSIKKALEAIGASDIHVNKKGFWYVSGEFSLHGKLYKYGSCDLRRVTVQGSDDIDLNADAPLYYFEKLPNGKFGITRDNLNELFSKAGVRVPMKKHEYIPWAHFKRRYALSKPGRITGTNHPLTRSTQTDTP